tara:strand:+ start:3513 stop:4577 length:1065 start_codon:yes stop_codon:yes gene_type:complete
MAFAINGRKIGPEYPPYVIAELSANHNGDIEKAFKTIKTAQDCGADAIKIQTYTADTMTIDCDSEDFIIRGGPWDNYKLYDLYKEAETPYEWHKAIFDYAAQIGITLFSTPFDESAVDLLESLATPAYKIASFEATDLPLIRYAATKKKPLIISTGICSEQEIQEAISSARDAGCEDIAVLHCISSYPAPMSQANLLQIPLIRDRFQTIVGLSDHTLGTTAAVAAVALGASIIEKHFTLSRDDKGPDSGFSIEPNELTSLCRDVQDAWLTLGGSTFERQIVEQENRKFRRSIYFVKDIKAGETITKEHVRRIRPGLGLAPKFFDEIIGCKVKKNITRGTAATWELIDRTFSNRS